MAEIASSRAVFLTTPLTVIGTSPASNSVRLTIGFAIIFLR
ncbi:hypothetical protein [Moraxella lacunata]